MKLSELNADYLSFIKKHLYRRRLESMLVDENCHRLGSLIVMNCSTSLGPYWLVYIVREREGISLAGSISFYDSTSERLRFLAYAEYLVLMEEDFGYLKEVMDLVKKDYENRRS